MKRNLTRIATGVVALTLAAILAACSSGPAPSDPGDTGSGSVKGSSVLVVPYWLDQFNTANTNWITNLLKEQGATTVDVINPNKVASKQLSIIETAISSQKYDAIVWQPIDETTAPATIRKIQDAGIAQVVAFSSIQPGTDGLNFSAAAVKWDKTYFDAGVAAGEYVKEHPELGPPAIAFANIFPAEQKCNDVRDSLVEGVKSVLPDVTTVYDEGATSQAQATSKMTDFLARGIDFNIFAGCATTFDMGGFQALNAEGLVSAKDGETQNVYAVSLDASPPELQYLWDPNYSMMRSVMFGPKSAAEAVVKLVVAQLNGEISPTDSATEIAELITLDKDCEKGTAIVSEQFEGVEGFEIPECKN